MPDELMTPAEVAHYLSLKIKTLHNWRSRRIGPPGVKVGGALRYRREVVDGWLATQEAAEARVDVAPVASVGATVISGHYSRR